MKLGVNLSGIDYWSPNCFLDRLKTAGAWQASGGAPVPLDASGVPTAIPAGADQVGAIFGLGPVDAGAPDTFELAWDGGGTLSVGAGANPVSAAANRVTLRRFEQNTTAWVTISAISAADPVRNIRIVREDQVDAFAAGERFEPSLLLKLKNLACFRTMDWQMVNGSPAIDEMVPADAFTFANGVPIQTIIDLAKRTGIRPWICIPAHASDTLVRKMLAMFRDAGINPFLEYSNEVWNEQYEQATWARQQAAATWGDGAPPARWYGFRAGSVARIAREFGFRVSLMWQMVQPWQADDVFAGVSLAGAEMADFEGWGGAAYIKGDLTSPTGPTLALAAKRDIAGAVDNMLHGAGPDSIPAMAKVYQAQAAVARAHGLDFLVYEGGDHLNTLPNFNDDKAAVLAFYTAIRNSPLDAQVMTANLQALQDAGCSLATLFSLDAPPSEWGVFGLYGTPAWNAIQAWVAADPAPAPDPTPQLSIKARLAALEVKIVQLMKEKAA